MLTTLSSRSLRLSERLFVMRPHSQNTDDTLLDEHFIHQSMLDIDSAGISAREITNQLLVRRWVLQRVSLQYSNPCLHFGLEARRSNLFRILERRFCVADLPRHQTSYLAILPGDSPLPL